MKTICKALAVVLLFAVMAAAVPAQPQMTAAPQGMSGCHYETPRSPAPQPARYLCCQAGHRAAILQAPAIGCPAQVSVLVYFQVIHPVIHGGHNLLIRTGDPPGNTPIRI